MGFSILSTNQKISISSSFGIFFEIRLSKVMIGDILRRVIMGEFVDGDIDQNKHSSLAVRLEEIELKNLLPENIPLRDLINLIRREIIFQTKLLRHDINQNMLITALLGASAFLIGALAGDIFNGGDAALTGLEGIRGIPNVGFFMIATSIILWIAFFTKLLLDYPIMRQQSTLLFVAWISLSYGQVKFHALNPDFPAGLKFGQMPIGLLATTIAIFITYMIWKAIRESRDWHVETFHLSEDVREMETAMREHSLKAWSFLFLTWLFVCLINAWSGAHFVGDRTAERIDMWFIHALTGVVIPIAMIILVWFPQKMLGGQGRILSKAASAAAKDLKAQDGLIPESGTNCQVCGEGVPLTRDKNGDISAPCKTVNCNAYGSPSLECSECSEIIPTRYTCEGCGTNAPLIDYFPDLEAW